MAGEVTFKHKHRLSPSFFLLSVCSNFFNLKKITQAHSEALNPPQDQYEHAQLLHQCPSISPGGVRTVFTNKITVTRLKIWFGNCSMGMFHFSVEYYGVATRTDSLQGVLQNFKQHPRAFAQSCSVTEQCLITSSEIRDKRFHRAVLSDNRFTEKQRMTISPNSSNVSWKQLLNTWSKSSDSPSATLFYSWILWGLKVGVASVTSYTS